MTPAEASSLLRAAIPSLPERRGAVRLEHRGPVAHIILDNPGSKNAITGRMMLELYAAVQTVLAWDGAAVVLRGAPCGAFCSGGHLGDVRAGLTRPDLGRAMSILMTDAMDRFIDGPFVSVAAIDGIAMGGGAELCTAADFRVATPGSSIHFVHAQLGVAPGWGGAARLVRHIGRRAALRLLSTAEPIDIERAVAIGLIDHVAAGDAVQVAEAFLAPVTALSPRSVRAVKTQVAAADDPAAQSEAFLALWGGDRHNDALQGDG